MSDLTLNPVPTGFGIYTGINLVNNSQFTVEYTASMGLTSFGELNPSQYAREGFFPDNTLFITKTSPDTISEDMLNSSFSLGPKENGVFYVLHKPFNDFAQGQEVAGDETATLTISSVSEIGDSDSNIVINLTGQRVLAFGEPSKVSNFIVAKTYSADKYKLNFSWSYFFGYTYVTRFKIELATDVNFSSVVKTEYINVDQNYETSFYPLYGGFKGLVNKSFSHTIEYDIDVVIAYSNLYARLTPINDNYSSSNFAYSYVLDNNPNSNSIPESVAAGSYVGDSGAGDDLKFELTVLNYEYVIEKESNFDILAFLVANNSNSYKFNFCKEINITFRSSDEGGAFIYSSSPEYGALNFKRNLEFSYGVSSGVFKLNLFFKNVTVVGYNGRGASVDSSGANTNAENGGAIFHFDNMNESGKVFDFYIYKDSKSSFIGGFGGEASFLITKNTAGSDVDEEEIEKTIGDQIPLFSNIDFVRTYDSKVKILGGDLLDLTSDFKIEADADSGDQGKLNYLNNNFPNIYLDFDPVDSPNFDGMKFRFSTDGISDAVGTTVANWVDNVDSDFYLKSIYDSVSVDLLKVREAYGIKFYELLDPKEVTSGRQYVFTPVRGSQQNRPFNMIAANTFRPYSPFNESATAGDKVFNVDWSPCYTILVVALARTKEPNETDKESYIKMFDTDGGCFSLHKFSDSTKWKDEFDENYYADPENFSMNFQVTKESKRNPFKLKSTFVGSTLNRFANYSFPYQERVGNEDVQYHPRQYWHFSNPIFDHYDLKLTDWDPWGDIIYHDQKLKTEVRGRKNEYFNHNLCNFNSLSSQSKLVLDNSQEFDTFSFLFIQMHTSFNSSFINDSFYGTPVQKKVTNVREETYINGQQVLYHKWARAYDAVGGLPQIAPRLELLNVSNNNTKVFLFDYMHKSFPSESVRDFESNNMINYLSKRYSPILLRNQSSFEMSNSSNQLNFNVPLGHPYLNIYTS